MILIFKKELKRAKIELTKSAFDCKFMSMRQRSEQQDVLPSKKLKQPSMYKVLLLNDDFTTMDFVVYVLQNFFSMDMEMATKIMLQIHTEGSGMCGVYTKDIANSKVMLVHRLARLRQYPLRCVVEEDL